MVNALKAARLLQEKNALSKNFIIITVEMYQLQKVHSSGRDYLGADRDGNLYKGVMIFMINGLNKTRPIVIKAGPETH